LNSSLPTTFLDDASIRLAKWLREPAPWDSTSWSGFAQDAAVRGLAGLVLEQAGRDGMLPPAVRTELTRSATRVAYDNVHAMHQTAALIEALNRARIPVMLLKGAALLKTVYEHPDLRPMSDVDLLVRPEHALRAVEVLQSAGCRRGVSLVREDFFPRFHYEVELLVPGLRPVRIDLHARPFRPLRLSRTIPDEALWEGAIAVHVGGAGAVVPRPESLFVHLATHAAFHGCARLVWLYDLVRLVRFNDGRLKWELILKTCRDWRLGAAVGESVGAAEGLLGPFVAAEFRSQLTAAPSSWRDRLALRQAPRDAQSPWRHVLVNLLCTPGMRFKLAYLWAMSAPDEGHLQAVASGRFGLLAARVRRLFHAVLRPLRNLIPMLHRRREFA